MPAAPDSNHIWVCLGRVLRPHGIKGGLSVKLENPDSEALKAGIQVRLDTSKGQMLFRTVKGLLAGRILFLENLEDRTAAEAFSQAKIWIRRSDFPALEDDEIYLNDMIGFEVLNEKDLKIGVVEDFSHNGAQLLLGVRLTNGDHGMIPFVSPLVRKVAQEDRKIFVELPEGLFEKEDE